MKQPHFAHILNQNGTKKNNLRMSVQPEKEPNCAKCGIEANSEALLPDANDCKI